MAIPTAAVDTDNTLVDMAQKGPAMDCAPTIASENATIREAASCEYPAATNAHAEQAAATAVCQRRSLARSECRPYITIAMGAAT